LVINKDVRMYLTVPLVLEYEAKLREKNHLHNLSPSEITNLVDQICAVGYHGKVYFLHRLAVGDADDAHVLEAVTSTPAQALITRNTVDFTTEVGFIGSTAWGVPLIKPAEYMEAYRSLG
jgi:predicted nucleic acid-binding protein